VVADAEPATLLARVQSAWEAVAGTGLAASARPVAERDGVVTVGCESAVWAQELELLGPDLVTRLNDALAPAGGPSAREAEPGPVARLRFVVGSLANR